MCGTCSNRAESLAVRLHLCCGLGPDFLRQLDREVEDRLLEAEHRPLLRRYFCGAVMLRSSSSESSLRRLRLQWPTHCLIFASRSARSPASLPR